MTGKYKVYLGGWYQRTTLHLTELYDFLTKAKSDISLDVNVLRELRDKLELKKVSRENGYLEYIFCESNNDISIKYYEDGLYILSLDTNNPKEAAIQLKVFYENKFSVAISYIFSLGAPTPKVLANIQQEHPFVVVGDQFKSQDFGEVYSKIESELVIVTKTPKYILFESNRKHHNKLEDLIETQIFFREFKDQLHKYLNIHRKLWEEISAIKDKGSIKGSEVLKNKAQMESYERTINLISNRINQMSSYIKTRQSIAKELKIEEYLSKVFDYKFETLTNTHNYIKEIWVMTKDLVKNVLTSLSEIESQSLNNSIKSLQIITSMGVVSGILGYISRNDFPKISSAGGAYFVLLVLITLGFNQLITLVYKNIKYKIKVADTSQL